MSPPVTGMAVKVLVLVVEAGYGSWLRVPAAERFVLRGNVPAWLSLSAPPPNPGTLPLSVMPEEQETRRGRARAVPGLAGGSMDPRLGTNRGRKGWFLPRALILMEQEGRGEA
jgi:hypothetical protein